MARSVQTATLLLGLLVALAYAGTATARPMPRTIVSGSASTGCCLAALAACFASLLSCTGHCVRTMTHQCPSYFPPTPADHHHPRPDNRQGSGVDV